MRPMSNVDEFNKIQQIKDMDQFQEKFEELMGYMLILNPLLNEPHFISIFVSSLKPELKPLVLLANPASLMDTFETVKLYEKSFQALTKMIAPETSSYYTKPYPKSSALPLNNSQLHKPINNL